jgi:uncharacterized protein (DUF1697 family)
MTQYVAFLRGINVGGKHKVPMSALRRVLEDCGFANVKTLLVSGNVVFEARSTAAKSIVATLEKSLAAAFGFAIPVILRTRAQLEALARSKPFAGVRVTADTRLYVTLLAAKPTSTLAIPYVSPGKEFRILRVTDGEVCSVLTVTRDARTVVAMSIIEREFGKNVTTRSWNTIEKVLAL